MDEEKAWVLRAQQGNDEAFTRLVEIYQDPVYNLCYRMLGNASQAEDAAQESFLRAYKHLHRYDTKRPFATWLLTIAAHYCIDRQRKKKLSVFSLYDETGAPKEYLADAGAPHPEKAVLQKAKQEEIQVLLQSLGETDRAAIVLRYWHEASEAEIAETLGVTVSAVKSRLHRARRKLAEALREKEKSLPRTERMSYESPIF